MIVLYLINILKYYILKLNLYGSILQRDIEIVNNENLINKRLKEVSFPIRMHDVIGGDGTGVVIQFKGRS